MIPTLLSNTDTDATDVCGTATVSLNARHRISRLVATAVVAICVLVIGAVLCSKLGGEEVKALGTEAKLGSAMDLDAAVAVTGQKNYTVKPWSTKAKLGSAMELDAAVAATHLKKNAVRRPGGLKLSSTYGTSNSSGKESSNMPTFGGGGGEFDDYGVYGMDGWGIAKIEMRASETINMIRLTYKSGRVEQHGNQDGGTMQLPFYVGDGEWISKVVVVAGTSVDGLQFFTNTGRNSVYAGKYDPDSQQTFDPSPQGIFSIKGRSSSVVNQLQFYTGNTFSTCTYDMTVTGSWQPYYYNNGGFTLELEMGTTHSNEVVDTQQWGQAVAASVEAGFDFMAASASVSVSTEFSSELGHEYSTSFSSSSTQTQSVSFETGGQLWAFVFHTEDRCGVANTLRDYVMTRNLRQPPCCLPGLAKDVYAQFGPCSGPADRYNGCLEQEKRFADYGKPMLDGGVMDQYVHMVDDS